MRIHSNVLTPNDLHNAARNIAPGVEMRVSHHKSRSHANGFEISLIGNGYQSQSKALDYREKGATWDEWGVFLGRLYVIDPEMLCGTKANPYYRDADHYNWSTGNRFAPGSVNYDRPNWTPNAVNLPADTHKRHVWDTDIATGYTVQTCKRCTAVRRFSWQNSGFGFTASRAGV